MKRFLLGFLLGIAAGAAALWQLQSRVGYNHLEQAGNHFSQGAKHLSHALEDSFTNLTSEGVREELAATSMIVREKARYATQALMDATANARLTASVKYKLLTEPELPGMRINVDSAGGLVTLSGTVDTHEQVARAVRLALETEDVTKVVSTIQVPPSEPPPASTPSP